tara:strand:- start:571 stop:1380 length:810 start_codon:yes stop_codon:yes gene_type:complete
MCNRNNKPKFSVITVVKNSEKKILKTLKSVKFQSYKNFEHIIVDGFSNDNTPEKITLNKYSQLNFFKFKDKNLYDAINFALKKSKGQFVLFLHAGDFFFSEHTLRYINEITDEETDIILGGCIFFNEKFKIKRVWEVSENFIDSSNSLEVPHTGTVISKNLINKLGLYNIKYSISSDTDYLIRLFKNNNNIKVLNDFVCFMETGGLSTNYKTFLKKLIQDLQIYYKHFGVYALYRYFIKIFSKIDQFNNNYKNLGYEVKLINMIKLTES